MKKYNFLITGSGGREHALYNKIKQSPLAGNVYVIPGNPGISGSVGSVDVQSAEFRQWVTKNEIDIIIPGPEKDLFAGIADAFKDSSVYVFGPDKNASLLEASKIYSKRFMHTYGIPTAPSFEFADNYTNDEVNEIINRYKGNIVFKYDGLAAGKGVFVCSDIAEAQIAFNTIKENYGPLPSFLIEEKLTGDEISVIGLTDGKSIKLFQASRDHKRLLDNDKGPNTGGMGAYTPVPFLTDELKNKIQSGIIEPTMRGIIAEQLNYKGFLYFGIMTDDRGEPYVLEYNVRSGDPETEVILPALKSDLAEMIVAAAQGKLESFTPEYEPLVFIDVVLAAGGYPEKYETGNTITLPEKVHSDCTILHAGTALRNGQLVTSGGRVLHIVASGTTLEQARTNAYKVAEEVSFSGKYCRTDIGNKSL